jgi:23S rRNA pseudouridine1911/1915/1917 synthase
VSVEPFELAVTKAEHGERLDRVLAKRAKSDARFGEGVTRSALQRWIAAGHVQVSGAAASADTKVIEGQAIAVRPLAGEKTEVVPDADVPFEILHVDDDLVVVSKPAGLVVHPARGHYEKTLVHGLLGRGLFRAEDIAAMAEGEGAEHVRPGIVHRIDMETSGILVVARNAFTREALKALFQAHDIERAYEAFVVGRAEARTYRTLHGRHPTDRLRYSGKVREGKVAVTHVEVVERFGEAATRVRCRLETGRTHQIRVHLSEAGTPILADKLYGRKPRDPRVLAVAEALGRHALHAGVLGFVHPRTRKSLRFEQPLPRDMAEALRALEALGA